MITINDFCEKFDACEEGKEWALKNCSSMQDAWNNAQPDWIIWIATREGVLTDKELRLFAVFCARKLQHLLTDARSINAIDVAERFAHGSARQEELDTVSDAASAAAWAASAAARDAAWAAAWDVASAAAWAASAAARDAARAAQSNWLRANAKPNFEAPKGNKK